MVNLAWKERLERKGPEGKTRKKRALLPQVTLRCTSSNGTDQYFVDGNYISKKKLEIVRGIAQREYYEQVIPVLERNLKKLSSLWSKLHGKMPNK